MKTKGKKSQKKEKLEINTGGVITDPGSTEKTKTGNWRTLKPVIDKEKCIKCGRCWMFCPDNAIRLEGKDGKAKADYDYCKGCGICVGVCPVNAIHMEKEEK